MNSGHITGYTLIAWQLGIVVLGMVIAYGVMKAGRLSRNEGEKVDQAAVAARIGQDPEQLIKDGSRNQSPTGWVIGAIFLILLIATILLMRTT
jgi:hypothetical protein